MEKAKIGDTILYKNYEFLVIGKQKEYTPDEIDELIILIDESNYSCFVDEKNKHIGINSAAWQIKISDIKEYSIDKKYLKQRARYFTQNYEILKRRKIIKQNKKKLII